MEWRENEIKYLAGLFDADGCLCIVNNNGYVSLVMNLDAAESIDREGKYLKYLSSKVGSLQTRNRDDNWATQNTWIIRKRSDLEMFLPRVIKHMVIKGNHWNTLLNIFREYKAIKVTNEEFDLLREQSNLSRMQAGPLKHKSRPTWAWTAGYIDGDGWYLKRDRGNQIEMHVGAVCHPNDVIGLELLQKAFGGVLKDDRGHKRWIRNLGPRDIKFALSFLRKMVNHSQLKKWKIEQLLSTYSQRLTV